MIDIFARWCIVQIYRCTHTGLNVQILIACAVWSVVDYHDCSRECWRRDVVYGLTKCDGLNWCDTLWYHFSSETFRVIPNIFSLKTTYAHSRYVLWGFCPFRTGWIYIVLKVHLNASAVSNNDFVFAAHAWESQQSKTVIHEDSWGSLSQLHNNWHLCLNSVTC